MSTGLVSGFTDIHLHMGKPTWTECNSVPLFIGFTTNAHVCCWPAHTNGGGQCHKSLLHCGASAVELPRHRAVCLSFFIRFAGCPFHCFHAVPKLFVPLLLFYAVQWCCMADIYIIQLCWLHWFCLHWKGNHTERSFAKKRWHIP